MEPAEADLSNASSLAGRAVVSLSGGLDSTGLLLHLLAKGIAVHGISFDYGQRHRLELERLESNLEYLAKAGFAVDWRLVDISGVGQLLDSALTSGDREMPVGHYAQANMRETVVPNRNAVFASIAWGWALSLAQQHGEPVSLGLGVHAGDHAVYPDCRPEFYLAIAKAFAVGNWGSESVRLYLPWLHRDKAAILRDALQSSARLGLDFDRVFSNTCTSYSPDATGRSHGMTGSDVERILAFHSIGRRDPLEYVGGWEASLRRALQLQRDYQALNPGAGS